MMNRPYDMYRKGGLKDEGGEIDEVSGNKVPIGGTKKGVRDDIAANLSEGEFVMPEDATRYHGLKTLMGMRQEAKAGLKQMEAMGLMGNADEATLPDDIPFGLGDLVVVELDADGIEKEVNMAVGGMASGQQGETVSLMGGQQPVPVRQRPQSNVTFDEIMGDAKLEFKEYRNAEGQSLMVPFIGGVPMYPIPEGYTLYTGEGGVEEPAVPEVPTTGMEQFVDDDDEPSGIAQQQPKSIDWNSLSDADFIDTANSRNGFGRNLASGIASMMNPLVGLAVNGLMRYEDQKVLDMAKTRLANLPANSPERAKYEQLIKDYEARNSGLFGGVINKMITKVGDLLGLNKEQTKQAKVNNMISHGKNNPAGPNGQVTADAVESSNSGTVVDPNTGAILTVEQYEKAIKDAESTDPNIANPAKETLANHTVNLVGEELANFVDPQILNRIQIGSAERTPEQTRTDIVNAVYQNVDSVKRQLDTLTPSQQEFLGYNDLSVMPNEVLEARTIVDDPNASPYAKQIAENTLREAGASGVNNYVNNYLDVVDTLREDVSQILPMDTERGAVKTRLISENLAEGETQRRGEFGLTPESRAASVERREAGTAMGMLDTSDSTATPITRDFTADAATVGGQQITTPTPTGFAGSPQSEKYTPEDAMRESKSRGEVLSHLIKEYKERNPAAATASNLEILNLVREGVGDLRIGGDAQYEEDQEYFNEYLPYLDKQSEEKGASLLTSAEAGLAAANIENKRRQNQVDSLVTAGVNRKLAEATVPKIVTPTSRDVNAVEGPESAGPQVGTAVYDEQGRFVRIQQPEVPTVTPTTPTTTTIPSVDKQTVDAFTPTVTTTKGVGSGRDFTDMPVTPEQQVYASAAQEREDPYDPRNITRVPSEQTTNIPVTTTAQIDTPSLPEPVAPVTPPTTKPSPVFRPATSIKPATIPSATQQETVPTIEDPTTPKTETQKLREMLTGTKPTTDTTTIAGFEAEDPRSQGKPATLKDVVPETTTALGEPVKAKETFSDAFAKARKAGEKTFTYDGKSFTTETKEEKEAREKKATVPDVKTAEAASAAATSDWVAATKAVKSADPDDPAAWTAAIKAQSDASKKATAAAKTAAEARNKDDKPSKPTVTKREDSVGADLTRSLTDPDYDPPGNVITRALGIEKKKDNDDGGGSDDDGGGDGCVIATHGISTGGFSLIDKAKAELWCERTYHNKWYGEAFRRGYRYAGRKAIERGEAEKYYQEFKDFVSCGRGLKKDWKTKVNYYKRTVQFFLTGLLVK